ncbi:MAG TPA: DNA polymerase IV [Nocardioidaceae bacterium]|nr:DNA polymerase IV [Nocardioidaceae bacterium]
MRSEASVMHLDLDAFYAAVEQRDKPSLRGKPVVVGGIGPRGVVATASYEARTFGVHSAMSTAEARARCPHAAFLAGRFHVYRRTSEAVMAVLREMSPLVEPLSLDEAFVDLQAGPMTDFSTGAVTTAVRRIKDDVQEVSGGLHGSVGVATSKLVAKIASDLDKPDGLVVVAAGTESDLLRSMQVTVIPGVGPATAERLRRVGVHTVEELERVSAAELVRIVGEAQGRSLYRLCRADDDRAVVAERASKSVSVEDTFATDLVDAALLQAIASRHAEQVCERLRKARLSGRTITLKTRLFDFTTHTRSATLPGPTDDPRVVSRVARQLLAESDTSGGVRLLGVGVSGLADWIQEDLFSEHDEQPGDPTGVKTGNRADDRSGYDADNLFESVQRGRDRWLPGLDVVHSAHGPGWVWGSGLGRVTVRFETAETGPGPVRTFAADDPDLSAVVATVPADDARQDAAIPEGAEVSETGQRS